jgi:hypothetical protein
MFDKPENSIVQPLAFSSAATEALVEEDSAVSVNFRNFEGVDWLRLKRFVTPLSTPRGKASWIFQHGWRVWKEGTHHPDELYFVCKYCHTHKLPNGIHRGVQLQQAINAYATYHIREIEQADEQATIRGNKLPNVPRWMRSDGLMAAD